MVGLTVDREGNAATIGGVRLRLRRMEADILAVLCRRPGATVRYAAMVEDLYGLRHDSDKPDDPLRCIKVTLSTLRRILEPYGARIEAVRGEGWRLKI